MAESEQQVIDAADVGDISSIMGDSDAATTETAATAATDETETASTATTATEGATMTETTVTSQTASTATAEADELVDVETLGKDLPAWKLAGVMRHNRWASGKALTKTAFEAAVATFEGRPLGGGR